MRNLLLKTLFLASLLVSACSDRGQVHIEHAWIDSPGNDGSLVGYLEVVNPTGHAIEIVSASSEAFETVTFQLRENDQFKQVGSLTVPARSHLELDGTKGQLQLNDRLHSIKDGDHLAFALAVRLQNGQLITLESELHVHEGKDADKHDHDHDHEHH